MLELCVYVEDLMNNFLFSVGKLVCYCLLVGEGIWVDDGFIEGMDVFIYYDFMLVKLVIYGDNWEVVMCCMIEVIEVYEVEGVVIILFFGKFVC